MSKSKMVLMTLMFAGIIGAACFITYKATAQTPVLQQNSFTMRMARQIIDPKATDAFSSFLRQYRRFYFSPEEYAARLAIFSKNYYAIKAENKKGNTFTLAINEFADMTNEEFSFKYLGYKKTSTEKATPMSPNNAPPASVDWVAAGKVSGVKNQGQCGSCWAFSAIGSLEGFNAINKKLDKPVTFSEQELVDCATGSKYPNEGCNGGEMESAFDYIRDNGIHTEDAYAYTGKDGTCKASTATGDVTKVPGKLVVAKNSDTALIAAISMGPTAVAIEADKMVFQFYFGGVIKSTKCGTNLDHGVLAVGYTDDYINVKNSWGGSWGEKGYVRIARVKDSEVKDGENMGICGIYEDPSMPKN